MANFFIAEADSVGNINSGTITQLIPAPSFVEYPPRFNNVVKFSKDGSPIVQAPLKDGRPRTWVWKRYKATIPRYTNLYATILNYQYKNRQASIPAKSPWVYVKESESGNLTYKNWNGTSFVETSDWVRVKVTQVTQNLGQGGGQATYDETRLEFVIDDPRWNNF